VPWSHQAACRSYRLHDLEHRNPVDRFLIVTAIGLTCPLVTYEERIARFGELPVRSRDVMPHQEAVGAR
jgi:PIN domain nuclease of toxin-antitoxin system